MKKKLALVLVTIMTLSLFALTVYADDRIKESASGYFYVEATETQVRLSAADKDLFIEVEGLIFKDLNKNDKLDLYEDWRLSSNARSADLLSQFTLEELVGQLINGYNGGRNAVHVDNVGTPEVLYGTDVVVTTTGPSGRTYQPAYYAINEWHITNWVSNVSGTPKDHMDYYNAIQAIAEAARLGIPINPSTDRTNGTWSGMHEMPRYALGVAGDPELLYDYVSILAKESLAVGNKTILHTFGHEIGYVYGDNPQYLSKMAAAETKAKVDAGIITMTKHFIGRGGRANFSTARSVADLWENWMPSWKAVIEAGTPWIMANNAGGLTPGLAAYVDPATMGYLRNELGFDGVVTLDWPWNIDRTRTQSPGGVLPDGRVIADMTDAELYNAILEAGSDQWTALGFAKLEDDISTLPTAMGVMKAEVIYEGVKDGVISMELMERSANRVLIANFNLGLYEDAYRDWEAALAIIGSPEFQAEPFRPTTIEDVWRARNPKLNELEERIMVDSAILLTNDGILPLANGAKVYYDSNDLEILKRGIAEFSGRTVIVDEMSDADVIVLQLSVLNNATATLHEEAIASGKPIVLIIEITNVATTEPTGYHVENSNAILLQSFRTTPGYGQDTNYFHPFTRADITADMLYGVSNPGGKTLYEIGWTPFDRLLAFGDLQYDIGANDRERLYMAALVKNDQYIEMPNNLGNEMVTAMYGMSYGQDADIELKWLLAPREIAEVEGVDRSGNPIINRVARNASQQAGVPFEINFVAENHGYDGHVTAQVLCDGEVIAERFVALAEGQFRVITMDICIETAGEYEISVGEYSATIVVE